MKRLNGVWVCLLLLALPELWGQGSDRLNMQKYWLARQRQKEHYMVVGAKAGNSIPAGYYNKKDSMSHFGDGTIRLGWYISILASEWKLLDLHGKPAHNTEVELYYALRAIERLDSVSGAMWSWYNFPNDKLPSQISHYSTEPGYTHYLALNPAYFDSASGKWIGAPGYQSQALDGFFVRDDVPVYMKHELEGVKKIASSHAESWAQDNHRMYYANEMSQDQLVFLLMGLKFVDELVSPNVSVYGKGIRTWSKQICARLMDRLVMEYQRLGLPDKEKYEIVNPHLSNSLLSHPNVARGSSMKFYRFPTALIANKIVYGKIYNGFSFSPSQVTGSTYMWQAAQGHTSFLAAVNFGSNVPNPWGINSGVVQDNKAKEYALLAASDFFKMPSAPNSFHYLYNACVEKAFRQWNIYPLMNHVLFPPKFAYNKKVLNKWRDLKVRVEADLASYPCDGGYNYGVNDYTPNWGQTNKWFIYQSNQNNPSGNDAFVHFNGNGNGEDYMLLYNLYRLAYFNQGSFEPYEDLNLHAWKPAYPYYDGSMGMIENIPYPGTHFVPGTIKFKSEVNADANDMFQTGDVRLKSATAIRLLPPTTTGGGFKVHKGANFLAKIVDRNQCDVHGYKQLVLDTMEWEMEDELEVIKPDSGKFLPFTQNAIRLYPNPTDEFLQIDIIDSLQNEKFTLEVIDLLGKLHLRVEEQEGSSASISVSALKSGMYMVAITRAGGAYYVERFIKN